MAEEISISSHINKNSFLRVVPLFSVRVRKLAEKVFDPEEVVIVPLISLITPKLSCIFASLLLYINGSNPCDAGCVPFDAGAGAARAATAPNSTTIQERKRDALSKIMMTEPNMMVAEANRISFTRWESTRPSDLGAGSIKVVQSESS